MEQQTFSNSGMIYDVSDIDIILKEIEKCKIIKTNKKIEYFNIPCSFDIETSSFYQNNEKVAIMYLWSLGMNGFVILGRTWKEFLDIMNEISNFLQLNDYKRIIFYIHNLSYEFQFMREWLSWKNVFAIDSRKPLYALTTIGIEFRCSYMLSGYSLEKLGSQLQKYKVEKMIGDLDYKLIRHCKTPITEKERGYSEKDVRVVMSYIQEKIEHDGDITKIPLTKTGYVRNFCRNKCMYDGSHKKNTLKYLKYNKLMSTMTLGVEEYQQLKRAFQGGYTHASAWKSKKILNNVSSYDFTSSYPYVMISEKFPMGKSELIQIKSVEEFYKNLKLYCCLFDVKFKNLESITLVEHYLSVSKCFDLSGVVEDNGRVVSAYTLSSTITEQDFLIIKNFYKWKSIEIGNFRRYKREYLPTDLIKSILQLYGNKTILKDVVGSETEYLLTKEMVNAVYGMTVTDIVQDIYSYINDWEFEKPNISECITKYNNHKRRFLFYPWGVWVTAYARVNLFTGIHELQNDYVYSDTDAIKGLNFENHIDYINKYNDVVKLKLKNAMEYHNLEYSLCEPKTIEGITKTLGLWDFEGTYTMFKTLGAKRYILEKKGKLIMTVSGLNKDDCFKYLKNKFKTNENIIKVFDEKLYIPPNHTGKNTHTYIDYEQKGKVVDYLGVESDFFEKSSIHLEPTDYSFSLSKEYVDYLFGIEEER